MKVFVKIYCLLPVLILTLVGCGEMKATRKTARNVLQEMYNNGEISQEHLAYLEKNIDPETLNQSVEVTKTSDTSFILKMGDRDIMIDFDKDSEEDAPITAVAVNGTKLNLKSSDTRRRNRNFLEAILGQFQPDERDEIEDTIGLDLGDLIDLGYSEDRDDAQLILLGTVIVNALRNFRKENPDKPFVALYAFGNSAEAILHHKSAAMNNDKGTEKDNINLAKLVSNTGLALSFFNPLVGTIIMVLGALAS